MRNRLVTGMSFSATLVGAALLATGCSSSSKSGHTPSNPPATSTDSATGQPPTSATTGRGSAKAAFVAKANAVCKETDAKIKALPEPSGPTDYAAIIADGEASLSEFPGFITKIKAAVAESPDKDELTTKWVAADEADFAGQKPLLDKVLAAAKAHDAAQTSQYLDQLSNYKDHSAGIASYLNSYGLTDCATLEND